MSCSFLLRRRRFSKWSLFCWCIILIFFEYIHQPCFWGRNYIVWLFLLTFRKVVCSKRISLRLLSWRNIYSWATRNSSRLLILPKCIVIKHRRVLSLMEGIRCVCLFFIFVKRWSSIPYAEMSWIPRFYLWTRLLPWLEFWKYFRLSFLASEPKHSTLNLQQLFFLFKKVFNFDWMIGWSNSREKLSENQ